MGPVRPSSIIRGDAGKRFTSTPETHLLKWFVDTPIKHQQGAELPVIGSGAAGRNSIAVVQANFVAFEDTGL